MINTKDRIGNKPIHAAAMYGHSESIEFLLRKDKEHVHEINDRRETPLHLAVRYGHCPSAALLIKNGASLQAEDNIRDTAIHTAIQYKQKECLQLLLENGSSVFVLNRTDDSPMKAAQDLQDKSLITILQEYQFQGLFSDMAGLGIETKEEFESMLSSGGSYRCYWNRSFLVGPYNVGKTTLAKNLVGDPIPEERRSTDGIWIYLGRAGMDIDEKKWIFVPQSTVLNAAVQSMLISSSQQQESKEKMENLEDSDANGYDESNAIFLKELYADNNTNKEMKLLPNPVMTTGTEVNVIKPSTTPGPSLSETGQTDHNKSDQLDAPVQVSHTVPQISFKEEKSREKILTNDEILNLVLSAVKDGEYKMKLVPIDLWDFGGQKIYYMTHQLFISSRGIFIIIFNGSKEIHKEMSDLSHLPGQSGKKTIAVYLLHWVNSILTYCKTSKAGFPKILFVATHKDLIKKANIIKHKEKLTDSIEKLFEHHTGRKHLQINPLFFVNARDENDLEVDELRKAIVEVAFAHPSWGEPMPTVCVPLDLQLMEHAKNGQKIMSLDEIEKVNATNETMVLTASQLTTFLKLQHALGKYIYFSEGQLSKYVVIDPSYLVEVLKSVVTEEEFWPENEEIRKIYLSLRHEGILRKADLLTIWGQQEYRHIQAYNDYLINMLIHLDILIEPRSNFLVDTGAEIQTQTYYVPCMIKQKAKRPKVKSDSSIHLAYAFSEDVIPPAFLYRFLGTSMSMWKIKSMFTDCAIVSVDDCHELILYAEGKRFVIELVHKTNKKSIIGTVASTVQECLTRAIIEISKFYWSATDSDSSTDLESTKKTISEFSCFNVDEKTGNQQRIIPYTIEFGVRCSST
ncbi:uncharacterized protein LOC143059137 [Mytilus galloprovincialis]|uniref:uncharacterized protein LOC143059137 n=1 Tax=Mytilus galloprovincialis TaxID=29158 RepID=UPI003F7B903E